ncbi:T9SS type A sorting domain-containing protein, partial [Candidatus Poribacteria bacterium]|nr:T9SS type A sorting domain-containing protein [Candidatus Poribacteria bacterium]
GQHFGETSIPAAASVWAMDYAQHLSALRELYGLIATQPNSSQEVLELKQLLNRLIALAESQIIPSENALGQNYPNPFNPETWLPYQLSEASEVTITIYDAHGRVVKRIDLGYQQAGLYRTRGRATYWDGRNEVGEPVASGVYFYELAAERFRAVRRMVILK